MNRLRTTLALSALAIATAGGIATAGTDAPLKAVAPQLTDASGDSSGDAGSDIVSGLITTTGTLTSHTVTTPVTTTVTKYKTVTVTKKVKGKKKKVKQKVAYKVTVTTTTSTIVKSYTPDTLVASLTMAGPIDTTSGTIDILSFSTPKCGTIQLEYAPSIALNPGFEDLGGCAGTQGANDLSIDPTISGNTLTWTIPFEQLTATDVAAGTVLSSIAASSGTADPITGSFTLTDDDTATTDTTYTVA